MVSCHVVLWVLSQQQVMDRVACPKIWSIRHMLRVGFSVHVFGSRHSNHREPSNQYVAYTKHVRSGGLPLLMCCLQAAGKPAKLIHLVAIVYVTAE